MRHKGRITYRFRRLIPFDAMPGDVFLIPIIEDQIAKPDHRLSLHAYDIVIHLRRDNKENDE